MVKLYTTEDAGSVSFGGNEYKVKNGCVDVPSEAVASLIESHGFTARRPSKKKVLQAIPDDDEPETGNIISLTEPLDEAPDVDSATTEESTEAQDNIPGVETDGEQ